MPLSSQAIGMVLRSQLYAGIVDVPKYGIRNKRGGFDPLVDERIQQKLDRLDETLLLRRSNT